MHYSCGVEESAAGRQSPMSPKARYDEFMQVVLNRITTREFRTDFVVPREHFELIVDAARHSPSAANAQPWHFVAVTDPALKREIANCYITEQSRRVERDMRFPQVDYGGIAVAPGLIVVATDFRFVRAFPLPEPDAPESPANAPYYQSAERLTLQGVAAATMVTHLAAAALGYNVWWVTATGLQNVPEAIQEVVGIPAELSVLDLMCFGPPAGKTYKRWKKDLDEILNWDRFDRANLLPDDKVVEWLKRLPVDAFGSGPPPARPPRR
jgi:5,6-dimethylbenzimidazole synthase